LDGLEGGAGMTPDSLPLTAREKVEMQLESTLLAVRVPAMIAHIRRKKKWTQKHLAERCQTSNQNISRLEAGNMTITLEWLDILLAGLEVTPLQFFKLLANVEKKK
jgi:ribosome-binding protein aMBF1 (putative translation factor)